MKVTSALGRIFKPLVNFPKWMGLRQLKSNAAVISKMIKDLRVYRPGIHQETFDEAVVRLQLTEEDIKQRMRTCFTLSIVYSIIAILLLVYTIYLVLQLSLGMILGLLVTVLMSVLAYREHFWYFQMKTRRLGNSFQDWISFLVRGRRK